MSFKVIFPQVPFADPNGPQGISEAWYKWLLNPKTVTMDGVLGTTANGSISIDMSQVVSGSINPNVGTFGSADHVPVVTLNSKGLTTAATLTPIAITSAAVSGTNTNNNAAAGIIGEFVSSTVAVGSAVGLTTATTANVTSISLTGGDWYVTGVVDYHPAATTSITAFSQGSSSTSATLGSQDTYSKKVQAALIPNTDFSEVIPETRISISATTTIYLVANATFTASTLSAYGTISARRAR